MLDQLLTDHQPLTGTAYQALDPATKSLIKDCLKRVYTQHLRRQTLTTAEQSILSAAIPLMLWRIQGKSFSEIVSLRHAFLSRKDERKALISQYRRRELSATELATRIDEVKARYSQVPSPLPNKSAGRASLFKLTEKASELSYDALVFDTYDYLDKVISLSLVDPICAALSIYFANHQDQRARLLANFVRYGTIDELEIWLMRYGYGFEEIEWLKEHVASIDSTKIVFRDSIADLKADQRELIERYL